MTVWTVLLCSVSLTAQLTQPDPHLLAEKDYAFTAWSPNSPLGTYPASMVFWTHATTDPDLNTDFVEDWNCLYNLSARSRVQGDGELGFSFVNTGNAQYTGVCDGSDPGQNAGPTIPNGRLGAAVLALNTTGVEEVNIAWTGRTIAQNNRVYGLRLQYRIGDGGGNANADWLDFDDPVEYINGETGHNEQFSTLLPSSCDNQELVQVRWLYYYISGSGSRAQIGLDDIFVTHADSPDSYTISNPEPHALWQGDFHFTEWAVDAPAETYPANMIFWTHATSDPGLATPFLEDYHCLYNLENRSRVNGEGALGFSFVNTDNSQFVGVCDGSDPAQTEGPTIPNGFLGAAVLALNTQQMENVTVAWTGRTIAQNNRIYALRLQYRIGTGSGDPNAGWEDLANPEEYISQDDGHEESFVTGLPPVCADQDLVQVRWVYYYVSGSGSRAQIALDGIHVSGDWIAVNYLTTDPEPFVLDQGNYAFTEWSPDSPAETYPANMIFWTHATTDPGLDTEFVEDWKCVYNIFGRSRILGEGMLGVSFVNTTSTQFVGTCDGSNPNQMEGETIENGRSGAAVLALNTINQKDIEVSWTGRTINQNSRLFGLRMQYRIGNANGNPNLGWTDFETPIEYINGETSDSENFTVTLPEACNDKALVQLRWVYYYISGSGTRAHIALDDVLVQGVKVSTDPVWTEKEGMAVFPNPASNSVQVILPESWVHGRDLQLYNLQGQMVYSVPARERLDLHLGHLPKGMYFLKCGQAVEKLLLVD